MRSFLLLLMGLVCATAAWAEPTAELSEPVGGWRLAACSTAAKTRKSPIPRRPSTGACSVIAR